MDALVTGRDLPTCYGWVSIYLSFKWMTAATLTVQMDDRRDLDRSAANS